jgi:Xaa-Pro dipeptidase
MTENAHAAVIRPADLAFSEAEYASRVAAVRQGMEGRGIDLLLLSSPENVTYLTGYETIGYSSYLCLLLPLAAEPVMVVREMELDIARGTTWLQEFRTVSDSEDSVALTKDAILSIASAAATIGIEETAPFLTVRRWRELTRALEGRQTVDGSGMVEHARRIKSTDEIRYIREACALVDLGMRAAVRVANTGSTENLVSAAAYEAMVGGGSDFLASDPIVTSGPRATIAHTTFGNRALQEGDPVLIELGACKRRYFGALMRTVAMSAPEEPFSELTRVVNEALDACIETIKPGVSSQTVDAACRDTIKSAGYGDYFRKRTGYSIGVAFAPDWGEGHVVSLRERDETLLEPGMVFHIPPAIRIPGRTVFGASETVVVTKEGHEILTQYPRDPSE